MILFCQRCASPNRGTSGVCRGCGSALLRISIPRESWQDLTPEPEDVGQLDVVNAPQSRARERVLSVVATVVLLLGGAGAWWFASQDNRPECVDYVGLDCRVVVVQREVAAPSDDPGDERAPRILTRTEAEILDWLRIVELARTEGGTISEASVFAVAADRDRLTDLCTDVATCRQLGADLNIDLDGASGRLDFAADGSQRGVVFETSRRGRIELRLESQSPGAATNRAGAGVPASRVLVVADTPARYLQLRSVVQDFRDELARAGIASRVSLVRAGAHPVDGSGVRVVVGRGAGRAWPSLRTHEVSVSMQLVGADGVIVRTLTFEPAISQVLDASADGLGPDQWALLLTDCRQRRVAPGVDARGERASVKVVCVSHPNELRDVNLKGWDRIVLLAGPSEAGFAYELARTLGDDPTDIVALRLN